MHKSACVPSFRPASIVSLKSRICGSVPLLLISPTTTRASNLSYVCASLYSYMNLRTRLKRAVSRESGEPLKCTSLRTRHRKTIGEPCAFLEAARAARGSSAFATARVEAAALAFRKPRRESASDTRDITLFLYCERKDPVKAPLYRIRIFKSTISRSLGIKRPRRLKRRG